MRICLGKFSYWSRRPLWIVLAIWFDSLPQTFSTSLVLKPICLPKISSLNAFRVRLPMGNFGTAHGKTKIQSERNFETLSTWIPFLILKSLCKRILSKTLSIALSQQQTADSRWGLWIIGTGWSLAPFSTATTCLQANQFWGSQPKPFKFNGKVEVISQCLTLFCLRLLMLFDTPLHEGHNTDSPGWTLPRKTKKFRCHYHRE